MLDYQREMLGEAMSALTRQDHAMARLLVGKVIRTCNDPMVLRPLRRAYKACSRAMHA